MTNSWFTSDTHFGHANIIKYSNRPFKDVDEMNELMIQEWNARVKPGDLVYHNGDFAFMQLDKLEKLLKRLNGSIHLVLGNHDKDISRNKNKLNRFASIQTYNEIKAPDGTKIVLFHYGCRVWNKSHHGSILLYGHSHGSLPPYGKSVDIGVDCKEITPEYRPIHIDEIMAYMSKRETPVVDHHGEKEMDDK